MNRWCDYLSSTLTTDYILCLLKVRTEQANAASIFPYPEWFHLLETRAYFCKKSNSKGCYKPICQKKHWSNLQKNSIFKIIPKPWLTQKCSSSTLEKQIKTHFLICIPSILVLARALTYPHNLLNVDRNTNILNVLTYSYFV